MAGGYVSDARILLDYYFLSSLAGHLTVPGTHQVCSYLKAIFAVFPLFVEMSLIFHDCCLTSFSFLLKSHFFPDHPFCKQFPISIFCISLAAFTFYLTWILFELHLSYLIYISTQMPPL
jgi:hypothetical protein